ncbi:S8 family serine peptidase [Mariniblastus fucicola]|uniref:Thermophilic serine proteinase n=1 Tax=Mariniblastus fucicola TaxID=980251 RepID=A0A5B9P732_9BACT|nr:S8 family serine peptidase [Mariniblastus fucicola]QEG22098.1 Thermophilic serine proteinase precursor [Mariniblastus fucicola]
MFRLTKSSQRRRPSRNANSPLNFAKLELKNPLAANFLDFSVLDASQDLTTDTVFESGALSIDYDVDVTSGSLVAVEIFAQNGGSIQKLGEFFTANESDSLISLEGFSSLSGTQQIFGVASTSDGQHATSSSIDIDVLQTTTEVGSFLGTTFNYSGTSDSAYVLEALGGTDTLALNFSSTLVTDFNGESLASYDRDAFVTSQAFYQGSVYDYMTTSDGRELYFQGVERLEFSNGSTVLLQTQPNDPQFVEQWDIATGDVGDAWRFTRGSDEVLIVSLDTGVPFTSGTPTTSDFDLSNMDFISPDNESVSNGDHGHRATSVMVAEPNNNFGLAGINWNSPTLMIDVYPSTHPDIGSNILTDAILESIAFLDSTAASRIVFQGGIQGEYWLSRLDQSLLTTYQDSTLYSVAAGNGSVDLEDATSNPVYSAGVARLAGTYDNVMAIGALEPVFEYVDGYKNASQLPLAGYSNYGENLTFSGPSRTRSIGPTGSVANFGGTSNSNPVVAAYSSLVWSVDPDLTSVEVRDILIETAMDLGTAGRDTQFGWGTPDAGSAVRRAWAMSQNSELALLGANVFGDGADTDLGYLLASNSQLGENIDTSGGPVEVGLLSTTNTNLSSLSYTLVAGAGDADNGSFEITGDSLSIKQGTMVDFESQSSYSIRVEASDGSVTHEQDLLISVIDDAESTTFTIADGEIQRSMLNNFVVAFDGIVTLGSTPFEVVKRGTDGGVVDVSAGIDNSSGSSVVTLTFSGMFAETSGSLVDGNYQLTVFGDQIQTASGQSFDADGNGVAGGDLVFGDSKSAGVYRLYGDSNGDRNVNVVDLLALRQSWLGEFGDDIYNPAFDYNRDDLVSVFDLLPFRQNYNEQLDFA